MDFDNPPPFWVLVLIGMGVFILMVAGCCCTGPFIVPILTKKGGV